MELHYKIHTDNVYQCVRFSADPDETSDPKEPNIFSSGGNQA